jgi:SAM-dependent methyltransferase
MRELVGVTDPAGYENPSGELVFPDLPVSAYRSYLDFGSGCGRSARRLLQQRPQPERYLGVDLHRGMVEWCRANLAPHAEGFDFELHDVHNPGLNPDPLLPRVAPLPAEDGLITLVEATSVFTHLTEGQAEYYLDEVARVLDPEGWLVATFFLFDKDGFPFMQDFQNALYINEDDPTNAVVYDRAWLRAAAAERDLTIAHARAPEVRGFHTWVYMTPTRAGVEPVDLPPDTRGIGRRPPPLLRHAAERIGCAGAGGVAAPPAIRQRAHLAPADPLAVELANAKEYIASLEEHLAAKEAELARVSGGA